MPIDRPFAKAKPPIGKGNWLTVREKVLTVSLSLVLAFGIAQIVSAERELPLAAPDRFTPIGGQPFERAGENFPGSAFYFLDDDSDISFNGADDFAESSDILDDVSGGYGPAKSPIAASLFARGTMTDQARALQCLTTAIYYEAALEPDAGQQAVAQVILNRMMHPSYPNTLCGVIYQGSERPTGCQFSFSCDGSMARQPSRFYWNRAKAVAAKALSGHVYAPAGLATHYHTTEVNPYWAPSLDFLATIGAHRFYRWKGNAGLKSAFYKKYVGAEPLPGPKPKQASTYARDMLDPVALARAYETARLQSEAATAAALANRNGFGSAASLEQTVGQSYSQSGRQSSSSSGNTSAARAIIARPPVYSEQAKSQGGEKTYGGNSLPGSSQALPQYRESGKWISDPGK